MQWMIDVRMWVYDSFLKILHNFHSILTYMYTHIYMYLQQVSMRSIMKWDVAGHWIGH